MTHRHKVTPTEIGMVECGDQFVDDEEAIYGGAGGSAVSYVPQTRRSLTRTS